MPSRLVAGALDWAFLISIVVMAMGLLLLAAVRVFPRMLAAWRRRVEDRMFWTLVKDIEDRF